MFGYSILEKFPCKWTCLPHRYASIHICVDDSLLKSFIAILSQGFNTAATMWSYIVASAYLFFLQISTLVTVVSSTYCKASPESSSWPNPSKWAALNSSLHGRLLRPSPVAAVCHPERPECNDASCTAVRQNWYSVDYFATLPIDPAWVNWSNDSCIP